MFYAAIAVRFSAKASPIATHKANVIKSQLPKTIRVLQSDDAASVHGKVAAVQQLVRCETFCDLTHEPPAATACQSVPVIVTISPIQTLHGCNVLEDARHYSGRSAKC